MDLGSDGAVDLQSWSPFVNKPDCFALNEANRTHSADIGQIGVWEFLDALIGERDDTIDRSVRYGPHYGT